MQVRGYQTPTYAYPRQNAQNSTRRNIGSNFYIKFIIAWINTIHVYCGIFSYFDNLEGEVNILIINDLCPKNKFGMDVLT
jgi:hypothetical protein